MKYLLATPAPPIKRLAALLLLALATTLTLWGQNNRTELETKRKRLIEEINQTSNLLQQAQQDKKAALDRYFALENQIAKRRQLIQTLQSEIVSADTAIIQAQQVRLSLEEDLARLRQEYASALRHALRHYMGSSFAMFLFSAKDFNDAFRRWQYIRQYYRYRHRQAQRILDGQQALARKALLLEQEKTEKTQLLAAQKQQQTTLNTELADKDRLVKQLRQGEEKLVIELNRQQRAHQELNRAIEEIIRNEVNRKKKEARSPEALTAAKEKNAAEAGATADFAQRKGKMPWPVNKGYITRQFGAQPHPTLEGIKIKNNGIDIRTDKAAEVYAVFEGTVVGKKFVTGYQNTLLIQHGQYYTVYSNLAEVLVEPGAIVTAKQIIGRLSSEKPEVHFEVWHEKEHLNPVLWVSQPQ